MVSVTTTLDMGESSNLLMAPLANTPWTQATLTSLELLSKLSQADDDERYENESTKDGGVAILTDQQTPEVAQPAEEPLHLPPLGIVRPHLDRSAGSLALPPPWIEGDGRLDPLAPQPLAKSRLS
jgi:hypothetical protein